MLEPIPASQAKGKEILNIIFDIIFQMSLNYILNLESILNIISS